MSCLVINKKRVKNHALMKNRRFNLSKCNKKKRNDSNRLLEKGRPFFSLLIGK